MEHFEELWGIMFGGVGAAGFLVSIFGGNAILLSMGMLIMSAALLYFLTQEHQRIFGKELQELREVFG